MEAFTYKDWDKTAKIHWWERIALWFIRGKWTKPDSQDGCSIYYKTFRGKFFTIAIK